ncbi:MAG: hypothetical protein ACYTGP_08180 [Planctomycetota bacterium]|jgi:hypothetical protein
MIELYPTVSMGALGLAIAALATAAVVAEHVEVVVVAAIDATALALLAVRRKFVDASPAAR